MYHVPRLPVIYVKLTVFRSEFKTRASRGRRFQPAANNRVRENVARTRSETDRLRNTGNGHRPPNDRRQHARRLSRR